MSAKPADVPLSTYFTYARRHAPIIGVCMLIGVIAGVAVGHRVATYVGTAAVLAPPLDLGPHGVPGAPSTPLREKDAVTPDTEAQIATSTPVLAAVRAATGLHADNATLAKRVTIDAPVNTQVLAISFEARHPKVAVAGAQAAAEGFITARGRLIDDRQAADLGAMNAQVAALRVDLATATTAAVNGSIMGQLQQGVLIDEIRSIQRSETRLGTAKADAGTILRPAAVTALHVRLGREVPVASGLLLGLLAGLGLGRIRRRRFISAFDLQRAVIDSGPIDIVRVSPPRGSHRAMEKRPKNKSEKRTRPPKRRTRGARGDIGLRRLRNVAVADGGGITMFTGPAGSAVTAAVAGGLARSLARLDEPVGLLVSADEPQALAALGLSPGMLLDSDTSPVATGAQRAEPGDVAAYRLPTGPAAVAAAATLRRAYPYVVVVTSGDPDAEVCAVARLADRVLVSAERRRATVRDVVTAIRRLRLTGAPVTTSLLVGGAR